MPTKTEGLPSTIERGRQAGIEGRSNISKDELADALRRHNDRETARARR